MFLIKGLQSGRDVGHKQAAGQAGKQEQTNRECATPVTTCFGPYNRPTFTSLSVNLQEKKMYSNVVQQYWRRVNTFDLKNQSKHFFSFRFKGGDVQSKKALHSSSRPDVQGRTVRPQCLDKNIRWD